MVRDRQGRRAPDTTPRTAWLVRGLGALGVLSLLAAAVAGGLLRAGAWSPGPDVRVAELAASAAVFHAALMLGGFFGTVVGVERAVAARWPLAWLAPLLSAAGGVALLMWPGAAVSRVTPLPWQGPAAAVLLVAGALVFLAVNLRLLQRQRAAHTALLAAAAVALLAGHVVFAQGAGSAAVLPWWFSFLVLTVAAERLEMARLMRRRPGAFAALALIVVAVLASATACSVWGAAADPAWGLALAALGAWLLLNDIAWRTRHADGLPRYMAVCLLLGHGWLVIGGLAWAASAHGGPLRDLAWHAIGLGFLVSMVMGHAPVMLPAVAGVKLRFGAAFYAPLALLHASLLLRAAADLAGVLPWRVAAVWGHVAALLAYALTVAAAAWGWRRLHGKTPARRPGQVPL
jgi:hypothetical protein